AVANGEARVPVGDRGQHDLVDRGPPLHELLGERRLAVNAAGLAGDPEDFPGIIEGHQFGDGRVAGERAARHHDTARLCAGRADCPAHGPLVLDQLQGKDRTGGHGLLDAREQLRVVRDGIDHVQVEIVIDVKYFGRDAHADAIAVAALPIDQNLHFSASWDAKWGGTGMPARADAVSPAASCRSWAAYSWYRLFSHR